MTDEQTKTEQAPLNNDSGNKPSADELIKRVDTLRKELEETTRKAEEVKRQNEELYTRMTLGGKGSIERIPELTQEQKDLIATKNYFKGSAIEHYFK